MITAAVRDALESTLIIKAQLSLTTHIIFTVCSVFRLKCVSDLSKYCVRIGERSSKRWFPHFKLCLYAYKAVMAVGVGILYDFPILYFVLLAINVCL